MANQGYRWKKGEQRRRVETDLEGVFRGSGEGETHGEILQSFLIKLKGETS